MTANPMFPHGQNLATGEGLPDPATTTRYRVTFVETTRYVVEFDSPVKLDDDGNTMPYDDENTEHDWFTTMDAAREDWPMTAEQIDVDERELEKVEELPR